LKLSFGMFYLTPDVGHPDPLGQTVLVCQSYNGGLWSPPQRACTEKSNLNMI